MAELKVDQPLTHVESQARLAINSSVWDSLKIALPWWFGAVVTGTGASVALVNAKMIQAPSAWAIISTIGLVFGPFLFGALEYRRLYERSQALMNLFGLQKEYDILILDARSERDQAKAQIVQMQHQVAATQNVTALIAAAIKSQRQNPGDSDGD